MVQRVIIHVGCPKTGTTGIQHQLLRAPTALATQGFIYPSRRHDQHFLATVDVLDLPWSAEVKADSIGAWDELASQVTTSGLDGIISHELLSRATPERVQHIAESFDTAEVSVVISARDLGRVIPAEYQEHLKYRSVMTYQTFLDRLREHTVDDGPGGRAQRTWHAQDVPAIAKRWANVLSAERVTIVTVPQQEAPRDLLLWRFGQAIGLDTSRLRDIADLDDNRSLGIHEVELLRRFNERYGGEFDDRTYGEFVRERLVRRYDVRGPKRSPLGLPPDQYPWIREVSEARIKTLQAEGYRVVGNLEELLPVKPSSESVIPNALDEGQMFEIALRELAHSVRDYDQLLAATPWARRPLRSRLVQRGKARLVREAGKRPMGQRLLDVWETRVRHS